MGVLKTIISVLFPPIGVFLLKGIGIHLLFSIILTFVGYIPGIIYVVYLLNKEGGFNRA
jgi:uncharacterized membrane protein YqaE (UPF0057 family)